MEDKPASRLEEQRVAHEVADTKLGTPIVTAMRMVLCPACFADRHEGGDPPWVEAQFSGVCGCSCHMRHRKACE